MFLADLYRQARPVVSFELFPPKTDAGVASLVEHLHELARCKPAFITCTYGAGGSTRGRTLEVLAKVREAYPAIPVASHLTCVGSTIEELQDYVRQAIAAGVEYLVALRGDPPKGETAFKPVPGGLRYANELVTLLRGSFPQMGLLVAGYPETHPEALSPEDDLDRLRRKVDAGADVVLTQLFYDNTVYFRFRDRCEQAGITIPIVPGVLPITRLEQIKSDKTMFGSRVPDALIRRINAHPNDEEGQFSAGAYFAARQVEDLLDAGAPGVHFYVLNKSRAAAHICRALALFDGA